MRQALLVNEDREMIVWLDASKRFRIGDSVTLKNHLEPKLLWTIKELYGTESLDNIHIDWRVGGL